MNLKFSHIALAASLAITLVAGGLAYAQHTPSGPPQLPDNCFCGPVDDCNGIPLSASAYCPTGWSCSCAVVNPNGCIQSLDAQCHLPS